jgi:tetratricopeptide (TPR) repeat protein
MPVWNLSFSKKSFSPFKKLQMKKQSLYLLLIALFIVTVSFVVIKYKTVQTADKQAVYPLVPRKGNANSAEWKLANDNYNKLAAKVRVNPADHKSAIALVNTYILEGRASGNVAYYDKAAMHGIEQILKKDALNYEAICLKALVELSQHHFSDGLATATKAVQLNPNSAFAYGLLVDANIEMGQYPAAVDAADKMVTARPDLRSYSRIAYLREIHGDLPGAIDAMKLAVAAGVPAEESTEWCRSQLGRLYESTGQKDSALLQYRLSLAARPDYPNALSGLARIAVYDSQKDSAVFYLESASKVSSDPGIQQSLAAVYQRSDPEKANRIMLGIITEMNELSQQAIKDPAAGHYSDRELAYAFLQNNDTKKALEHALAEYNRRPSNIDVNETVAWVYYRSNESQKALPFIQKAMVTKSRNPGLLCIAGLIFYKTGDIEKARVFLDAGLANQPILPQELLQESKKALLSLSNNKS